MGGERITVESGIGVGSTFEFKLVLHPTLERIPEIVDMYGLSHVQRQQLSHTRILFISDEGVAAHSWLHLMRAYGATVDHCQHIEQAAEYLMERANAIKAKGLGEDLTYQELCSLVSVIIIDLDKIDALEEQVLNSLALFSPLRLLFLRTKYRLTSPPPSKPSVDAANGIITPNSLLLPTNPTSSIHFHHSPDSGRLSLMGSPPETPVQPAGAMSKSAEAHLRGWSELTPEERALRRHHALSIKRILHKPFHGSVFLALIASLSFESFRSIIEFEEGILQQGMSTSEMPTATILAETPPGWCSATAAFAE